MRRLTGKWKLKPLILGRYKVMVEVQLYPIGEGRVMAPHWVGYEMAKGDDLEKLGIKTF